MNMKTFFKKFFSIKKEKQPEKHNFFIEMEIGHADDKVGFSDFMRLDRDQYDRQLNLYQILRDHIKHEDEVISHRLTWSLTAQGFLFLAYSGVMNWGMGALPRYIMLPMIGGLGFILCITLLFGIQSAIASLYRLHDYSKQRTKYDQKEHQIKMNFPPISGAEAVRDEKFGANVTILAIPRVFMIAWIVLAIAPLVNLAFPQNTLLRFSLGPQQLVQFVVGTDEVQALQDLGIAQAVHSQKSEALPLLQETNDGYWVDAHNASIFVSKKLIQAVVYPEKKNQP